MTSDTAARPVEIVESRVVSQTGLEEETCALVDAIGSRAFSSILFKALQTRTGTEHLTLYRFDRHGFDICGAASNDGSDTALAQCRRYVRAGYWRRDPAIVRAGQLCDLKIPVVFRVTAEHISDAAYKKEMYHDNGIAERIVVCADRPNGRFGLSLVRTTAIGDTFTDRQVQGLADVANVALSVAAKHTHMGVNESTRFITSFSSLSEIEWALGASSLELSMRERQVCARILYGLSIHGISLDLGIGEESVATYRKRSYRRLNIGSRYELLRLYMTIVEPAMLPDRGPRENDIALSLNKGTDATCHPS